MQKLVTVYLEDNHEETITTKYGDKEIPAREHLSRYLEDGWVVKSINTIGAADERTAMGWVVVLLEKS